MLFVFKGVSLLSLCQCAKGMRAIVLFPTRRQEIWSMSQTEVQLAVSVSVVVWVFNGVVFCCCPLNIIPIISFCRIIFCTYFGSFRRWVRHAMFRTTVPRVQNVLLLLIFPMLLIDPWEFAQVKSCQHIFSNFFFVSEGCLWIIEI